MLTTRSARGISSLAVGLLFLATAPVHADVVLVQDGQARAAIFVDAETLGDGKRPEKTTAYTDVTPEGLRLRVRDSVIDLAHYLEKISGAKVDLVAGAPAAGEKRIPILIGSLAEKKWGAPKKPAKMKQGLRVVVAADGVGLWGESDLSTSYAVYTFLHNLGCRWFMPSDLGEVIPSSKTISLKEQDVSEAPHSYFRGIWYADPHYQRRNRLGGLLLSAGHALEHYVSKEQRQAHPEWVGTVDGKPQPVRLRWSAKGLPEAIGDHLIELQAKAPATLSWSLSSEDGLGYDNSKEDQALDAGDFDPSFQGISLTDRQVWFCNRIAERVSPKYPDLIFGMLAYGVSTRPPVREKLHPALVPQIAPITYSRVHPMTDDGEPNNKVFRELLEKWGKVTPAVSYYYYCFFLAEPGAPNPFIKKWSVDVPAAFQYNCRYWQPETLANFEVVMHALYLGTRLSWDPTQKPADIFDELHRLFYGNAAKEMAAYWTFIDDVWTGTPEYSGCGFGHLRRFGGEKIRKARELMNAAIAKAVTPEEKFRIGMADDSLKAFELFLKMRADLNEGRFATLDADSKAYIQRVTDGGTKYEKQFAFGRMGWTGPQGIYGVYFKSFYDATHNDAARIAREKTILTPTPLQKWKFEVDKDKAGEAAGWQKPEFDDSKWKTSNPGIDTWSALGLHNYMGAAWYRHKVTLPAVPAGKKIWLWLGATDGTAKVFVNGKHCPWVNDKGEKVDQFAGYCQPASIDVTEAVKAGGENTIAVFTNRTDLNELGMGGLIAPVVLYHDK
ncbi:MAG: DUF4838 domain-containing protein [Planctomycetaceae bacterium]|nr:DUF4838 domain-containing protein [Planctomycetaceae bacterium]